MQIKLQDSWGWCADANTSSPTGADIFAKITKWILWVLNDGGTFSYVATDITVQEFCEAYTIGNASYNITYSPRASRVSTSIWKYLVSKPPPVPPSNCRNETISAETYQECVGKKSITLDVFIQVKHKDHRGKIAQILTAGLLKRPLPNDGISMSQANVTCPIQGSIGCTCQPSSNKSSGDL